MEGIRGWRALGELVGITESRIRELGIRFKFCFAKETGFRRVQVRS